MYVRIVGGRRNLLLPVSPDCVGIASGAFDGVNESVLELYITANITEIEEGALDSLKPLWYIEADPAQSILL